MLRTIFCVSLLFLVVTSILFAPAYSLVSESGPLNAFSSKPIQYSQGTETLSIGGFKVDRNAVRSDFDFIELGELKYNGDNIGRTLVYGSGNAAALGKNAHVISFGSAQNGQPLLGVAMSESPLPSNLGFSYSPDAPLHFDFDQQQIASPGRLSGSSIIGSDKVVEKYGINGSGVTVAIVDTGTDFSNPDMMHSLARDQDGVPIMLDADGQGIVLTRATYIAKIDALTGKMLDAGYTPQSDLPENMTSYVYVNNTGTVFLRTSHGDIPVYNTLYPFFGEPVLNATARVDWIIGHSQTDYIRSASGIYRFGVIFQTQLHFGTLTFPLVPVLVVDSEEPGVYDTIIPDMYSAWYFFTRNDLSRVAGREGDVEHLFPEPSFDFTDDTPIKIGDGNEFLIYDYNNDGFPDFSAGTVGARVVDLWQVASNKTEPAIGEETGYGGVVVADLLEPQDPAGDYFGLMYDLQGHGTSTAATVSSKGRNQYDIYDNGTKYSLAGIAPGAKIMPVKALWAGDALYAWLYAAGFDLKTDEGVWRYSGEHKADVVSNSWGISSFPLLQYGPGYDVLSVLSSMLVVPGLFAEDYPGVLMVNSLGNNGVGYGSVGSPNSSPLMISVGATTNNVHVGYDGFQNITRFGNTTRYFDDIADFSSRGPGLLGDPKPELVAIGSYAFTPTLVNLKNVGSTADDPNDDAAFALFGGTSMAAPMVAGAAALVISDMKAENRTVDPFVVKTVLMSSAADLKNDPFVQGSGRVDALAAFDLVNGKPGHLSAYTEDTVPNILTAMSSAIYGYNQTLGIIDAGQNITQQRLETKFKDSRWFAGYIEQGGSSSTEIVVENPSSKEIEVDVSSQVEKLLARYEIHNATRPFETDPIHNTTEFGYVPNYYKLDDYGGIPDDADLMVARVNFQFENFMNLTEAYGDYLRIASLYAYDWKDADGDGKVSFTENSMVNRGGSWGTMQELRIGDPAEKFENTPIIGVYPVPSVFSFWRGDRQINSTALNYTLTVEFYERQPNPAITLDGSSEDEQWPWLASVVHNRHVSLTIPPKGNASVTAVIDVDKETLPGVYQGSVSIMPNTVSKNSRPVLMPVSYVVTTVPVPKDIPVVIKPDMQVKEEDLGLRPNGYVGGLFDMTSRYTAGDWRTYYFMVKDPTINSMSLKISWPHNSTSINAMAYAPDGRMVASSVPAGVFETFVGWPSNDWLGTTSFSEGGAFYFSQNAGDNSTLLHVPVNNTGVYSLLLHNTVFHGNSLYEPVNIEAKFSTILPDDSPPVIKVDLPKRIGPREHIIPVTIADENLADYRYTIDLGEAIKPGIADRESYDIIVNGADLADGVHHLRIDAADSVGYSSSFASTFEVDRTPPSIDIVVQLQNLTIPAENRIVLSNGSNFLLWNVADKNGVVEPLNVTLPNATGVIFPDMASRSASINLTSIEEGTYEFSINAEDKLGNTIGKSVQVLVDKTAPNATLAISGEETDIKDTVRIAFDVQDLNLASAMLFVNDVKVANVTGLTEYELDTTKLPDGKHDIKLIATDIAGNDQSASSTIAVSNMEPKITSAGVSGLVIGLAAGSGAAGIAVWLIARRKRAP